MTEIEMEEAARVRAAEAGQLVRGGGQKAWTKRFRTRKARTVECLMQICTATIMRGHATSILHAAMCAERARTGAGEGKRRAGFPLFAWVERGRLSSGARNASGFPPLVHSPPLLSPPSSPPPPYLVAFISSSTPIPPSTLWMRGGDRPVGGMAQAGRAAQLSAAHLGALWQGSERAQEDRTGGRRWRGARLGCSHWQEERLERGLDRSYIGAI